MGNVAGGLAPGAGCCCTNDDEINTTIQAFPASKQQGVGVDITDQVVREPTDPQQVEASNSNNRVSQAQDPFQLGTAEARDSKSVQEMEAEEAAPGEVIINYDDGSKYIGELQRGRRHGHGRWSSEKKEYVGQWQNNEMHGQGTQKWTDGRMYVGQFKTGKFWGDGRMVWTTPGGVLVYEGQYYDDAKHGSGKFIWADSRSYDGEWNYGKRSGKGSYTNSKGQEREGVWLNNRFQHWSDGELGEDATPSTRAYLDLPPGSGEGSPRLAEVPENSPKANSG